ncbi:uncharacterized protein LOC112684210 [Sipha flava]|uniref:Uncharacterized protein LOC112684210 n=1 Tax=Sipha flava TaxID=143950 RepID=A0A8B8FM03_9HEMI|nr:uncharacterized protein LOC112684210 [Sipha flava]
MKLASCETTVGNIIKELLILLPTITDNIKCTIPTCTKNNPLFSSYITILVMNGNLNLLEEDIKARLMVETSKCQNRNRKGVNCNGIRTVEPKISAIHLFIELLNWEENPTNQNFDSEVAEQVLINLENVPQILNVNNVQYHLRGICSHAHEVNGQINDIGHYRAYCRRNGGNWELYDDQRLKSVPINSKTKVPCELLVYSI